MQGFSAVHLQYLQSAFAVLSRSSVEKQKPPLEEETVILPDFDEEKPPLVIQPAAVELISADQLTNLVNQQQETIQELQTFVNQLADLITELKQLKEESLVLPLQLTETATAISTVSEVEPIIQTDVTSEHLFEPEISFVFPETSSENNNFSLDYFSRLPWGSEIFVEKAAKMRAEKPIAQIPQIIQLATDSALKTAAQTALSSLVIQTSQIPSCGDYFQTLSWSVNRHVAFEELPQKLTCGDYFQTLSWSVNRHVAFEELPQKLTCGDYFQTLSWSANHHVVFEELPQKLTCGDYFQTLSWSANHHVVFEELPQKLPTCGHYFQNLSWSMVKKKSFQNLTQDIKVASKVQTCGDYFQVLPWIIAKNTPKSYYRRAVLKAIFANEENLS